MLGSHETNSAVARLLSISTIIVLLVVVANAYTVITKGGRRIEIGSRFVVTPATLTYEVSQGIQVTIPMAAIDISATEKANHETPGSLLSRAKLGAAEPSLQRDDTEKKSMSSRGRRTITNRDLETLMQRREEGEAAYEIKRKQLGLPSMEEQRKLAAAQLDATTRELSQKRIAEGDSESYWRARAAALRTEMAGLDAELNYIRVRLEDVSFTTPLASSLGSFLSVGGFGAFGGFPGNGSFGGRSRGGFHGGWPMHGRRTHRPTIYVAPSFGPQLRPRVGLGGGGTRGHVFVNPRKFSHAGPAGTGASFGIFPQVTVLGSNFQGYDFSYERSELITRFNELAAARAGLNVRWRELEDEARRAGVSPGWLRP